MKILVVDDHPLVREALCEHVKELEAGVEVFEAGDGAQALGLADRNPDLDLVLLDLHLPTGSGFSTLTALRERYPSLPVVILSAADDRDTVLAAIDRGAAGFVPKTAPVEVMLGALRLVLSGGVYLPTEVLAARGGPVESAALGPKAAARRPADLGLTQRQAEVLALMVQGKPNKLICRELGLSESTVKIHVSAILKALDVANRTQAVIAAERLGLRFNNDSVAPKGAD